jgi:hypothetical protein
MPPFKYTKKRLFEYCENHCVNLIGINETYYDNDNLGRDFQIKFICKNIDCNKEGKRCYKNFITGSLLCEVCTNKEKSNKREKTTLDIYGVTHHSQDENVKVKKEQTNLKKSGYKNPFNNPETISKIKKTLLEKTGYDNPFSNPDTQNKIKATILSQYGVVNVSQNKNIQKKKEETSIKNFGVRYALQNEDIKNKRKQQLLNTLGVENQFQLQEVKDKSRQTNLTKLGVEHPMKSQDIRNKVINTCLEKYGSETPLQNEEVKQKICETNISRYGVPYVSQNPEIMEKQSKNAYKLKDYILPSGNTIKIQGYENYALDELLQNNIVEENIVMGCKNVPEIWYNDYNGSSHRYYVDIFIPTQNRCIEVKSTWTAEKKKDCIFLKQQAVTDAGYECEIWVYNGKGEKVECYK